MLGMFPADWRRRGKRGADRSHVVREAGLMGVVRDNFVGGDVGGVCLTSGCEFLDNELPDRKLPSLGAGRDHSETVLASSSTTPLQQNRREAEFEGVNVRTRRGGRRRAFLRRGSGRARAAARNSASSLMPALEHAVASRS